MKTGKWRFIVLILIVIITLEEGIIRKTYAQYREIRAGLLNSFHVTGEHLPRWQQSYLPDGYPVGCGAVAWAMVYAYWSAFHGKNNLFGGLNINPISGVVNETTHSSVGDAISEIAVHLGTTFGEFDGGKYGRTWVHKFERGIQYAIKNGYRYSRVWHIRGTEFNKFEHVKRYLDADSPVIILMKAKDGDTTGIPNHYGVVEKAVKKEKLVNGKWRERDVRYDVKF
ncbi:MAG: hypothetical protein ACMUHX_10315 [bacterium]